MEIPVRVGYLFSKPISQEHPAAWLELPEAPAALHPSLWLGHHLKPQRWNAGDKGWPERCRKSLTQVTVSQNESRKYTVRKSRGSGQGTEGSGNLPERRDYF